MTPSITLTPKIMEVGATEPALLLEVPMRTCHGSWPKQIL